MRNVGKIGINNADEKLLENPKQKEEEYWGREQSSQNETINSMQYVP